jgi:quinoprotein glucose dehydrogenase
VHIVKLLPRAEAEGLEAPPGHDFGAQRGAPFAMTRAAPSCEVDSGKR